jgi:hypothetical protein
MKDKELKLVETEDSHTPGRDIINLGGVVIGV